MKNLNELAAAIPDPTTVGMNAPGMAGMLRAFIAFATESAAQIEELRAEIKRLKGMDQSQD
jgi:hypothetical protein